MTPSEIYKRIRAIRILKGGSQEDTAHRLGVALSSYAKIERGETDIGLERLDQVLNALETSLEELVALNNGNVLNILENSTNHGRLKQENHIYLTETQCAHELEKAQLLLKERDKEVNYLKEEITRLKEMFDWIKSKDKSP